MHEYPPHDIDASVTRARVNALGGYGFTQRQREFLVAVMAHSGAHSNRLGFRSDPRPSRSTTRPPAS
jgi:hypothetical protein